MFSALQEEGLENVHLEPVKVPHWERGEEFALMLAPRSHSISISGLGSSVPTPPEGITAEVLVVSSFDELYKRTEEAKGKIVVYNQPYISYGETVRYRAQGAVEAAKAGAVASLIRSITPFSINSPHTGWQYYQSNVPKIPTACISVEDAEMVARISSQGTKIIVKLKMGAKTYPDANSFNTVAEIVGSKYPDQVVLVSGHLDSWDVGQGAMDDGGGAFISWEALSLIKDLGLRPKRTLRLVLWTGEEQGGVGAEQYYQLHKGNISNFDIVMESDEGTFMPTGLGFTGSDKARGIMKENMQLLQPINVTAIYESGGGTDIDYWVKDGVPGASLRVDRSKYFWFHHSQGDTMTVQDPSQMNLCAAVWTVVSYVIADMEERLPSKIQLTGELLSHLQLHIQGRKNCFKNGTVIQAVMTCWEWCPTRTSAEHCRNFRSMQRRICKTLHKALLESSVARAECEAALRDELYDSMHKDHAILKEVQGTMRNWRDAVDKSSAEFHSSNGIFK
ncbi:carboxypeptidase Q [Alligator mississippiensis]|uniref:Carboxypeptidase Q n=1 Tax=Alligator mississippiensis TaxID=8496 RepID=A0A151MY80_ALLMI|nr:carboxypeptidase Q [Alligator mississippiensis]